MRELNFHKNGIHLLIQFLCVFLFLFIIALPSSIGQGTISLWKVEGNHAEDHQNSSSYYLPCGGAYYVYYKGANQEEEINIAIKNEGANALDLQTIFLDQLRADFSIISAPTLITLKPNEETHLVLKYTAPPIYEADADATLYINGCSLKLNVGTKVEVNDSPICETIFNHDFNGDGVLNSIQTNTYDTAGNLLTVSIDNDGDGVLDYIQVRTYTYDATGNLINRSIDSDGDGVPNSIQTNTYDTAGNVLTSSYDSDGDGVPNSIHTNTYDTAGNLLTRRNDTDGDGVLNSIQTNTYDTAGNLLTRRNDTDGDGVPNFILTNTYNSVGNLINRSIDSDGDGVLNNIQTNTYDSVGNLLTSSYDTDGDGVLNNIQTNTYDSAGNLLTISYENDVNGVSSSIGTYTYDELGNLIIISTDSDGDGVPNRITNYTHTLCPDHIPTMSEWSLMVFGLLVLNFGVIFLYRREDILSAIG